MLTPIHQSRAIDAPGGSLRLIIYSFLCRMSRLHAAKHECSPQAEVQESLRASACSPFRLFLGVIYLEAVARWILKEDCIVNPRVGAILRAFNIACSCLCDDFRHSIDFIAASDCERNPCIIRPVIRISDYAKPANVRKFAFCLERERVISVPFLGKSKLRQKLRIEGKCFLNVPDSKVDMSKGIHV